MSRRISSFSVPRAATLSACVWPRVKSAEPCVRGARPTSIVDRADLVRGAAVGALLVDGDALADGRLLERVERQLGRGRASRRSPRRPGRPRLLEDCRLDGLRRVLALELVLDLRGRVERCAVRGVDLRRAGPRRPSAPRPRSWACRPSRPARAVRRRACGSRRARCRARRGSRPRRSRCAPGLDHEDRVLGAGHDRSSSVVSRRSSSSRVDDEVAVDLADAHRADGRGERDVGDHERGGRAVHRQDVVRVDVVDRQRDRDELRLEAPALGEQRPDRPVDHAGGQRALLPRAALALEERAGDLAGGVHPLLDVHRQREEVDVAEVARPSRCRGPWCRPGGRRRRRRPAWPSRPVSNEISVPAISTVTVVTACCSSWVNSLLARPSVGAPYCSLVLRTDPGYPSVRSLSGVLA